MEENPMQENNTETQEENLQAQPEVKTPFYKKLSKKIVLSALAALGVLVLLVIILTSTPMKIHRFAKFTKKVEQNYSEYSSSDLEKATTKLEKHLNRLNECELSGKQERKVDELESECKRCFTKAYARIILKDFNKAIKEAGAEVEEAIHSMQNNE